MTERRNLTSTEILAAAASALRQGGYESIDSRIRDDWTFPNSRVFEDVFCIVAMVVFDSWEELVSDWADAQAELVDAISRRMSRSEPKAWEGYLVLFTPGIRGSDAREEWSRIHYNTSRLRKIVASGEELRSLADVSGILAPLLPLDLHAVQAGREDGVLENLPRMLAAHGVDSNAAKAVVSAYHDRRNMIRALYESLQGKS